jgi:alkylation response protein AidB-like acyl-CoA dehydrogenase
LDLLLTEQQSLFAGTAARLCADHGGPKRLRTLRAAGSDMDRDAWRAVREAGWLVTVVADDRGGDGLGAFDLALALEQAGRQLLMVPLNEVAAAAWILSRASDESRASRILDDVLDDAGLLVPATEAVSWRSGGRGGGLRYDHKTGVLDGHIAFVPFGDAADAFLVAIDSDPRPVLAIVPSSDLSVATEENVDGSTSSRLTFANVHVMAENVIATGAEARKLAVGLQELLMLGAAVELVGLAAAAHEITLDYVKLRQQFGKPIGSFQVLQHRAVDGFIDIELNRSLIYRVLAAFDVGEHHPAMVAAAKARASRTALAVTRAALQMHGAIGYTEEHDIGLYYKRAMVLAAQYGGELAHTGAFSHLTLDPAGATR